MASLFIVDNVRAQVQATSAGQAMVSLLPKVGDGINKAERLSQLLDIPAHLHARTHRNGCYSGAGDICCPEGRYTQEFRQ